MSDTSIFRSNRYLFFVSRALILMGMVLFFLSVTSLLTMWFIKVSMGIDLANLYEVLERAKSDEKARGALLLFQVIAGSVGTFLIPALLFPRAIERNPHLFIRTFSPFKGYYLLVAPLFVLISMPLISFLYQLNQGIHLPASLADLEQQLKSMEESAKQLTEIMVKTTGLSAFILNLIVVALMPAIAEEFFFRGVLQNFTRITFYNHHLAIWFAAFVFSAIHGQFYGFVPRLFLGAALGYLYHFSGSIWVPVLAHFLNNGLALVGFVISASNPELEFLKEEYTFPIYTTLLSILVISGGYFFLSKQQFRSLDNE